jgi:hypothetical protein
MTKIYRQLVLASVAVACCLSVHNAFGQADQPPRQGRREFDPERMRQNMMERYREQLEITNDDEWKITEERINKVNEARRGVGFGGFGGGAMFGRGGGRRGGDGEGGGQGDQVRRRGGGESSPEREALQKAIDSKAGADEIKEKLAKYREARKEKEAKLAKAQQDLREVLTVRQEATAVLLGLLQ